MNETPKNPATNSLGSGLTEGDIQDAEIQSGYPFQTVVAYVLRWSGLRSPVMRSYPNSIR